MKRSSTNRTGSHRLLLACCLGLSMVPCFGAEPQLMLKKTQIAIPEVGTISGYIFSCEGNNFRFVPPKKLGSVQTDKRQNKIDLTDSENQFHITIQVTSDYPGNLPDQDTLKGRALALCPTGSVFQNTQCPTGAGLAQAFDLGLRTSAGIQMTTRVVFIPFQNGTVEVTFTTPSSTFFQQRQVIGSFLGSLHIAPTSAVDER